MPSRAWLIENEKLISSLWSLGKQFSDAQEAAAAAAAAVLQRI